MHASPTLHVVGLNSARPFRHQGGALPDDQLRAAVGRLGEGPDGAYRVVVLHHHLCAAPWRAARKRPLSHRDHVLRTLAGAGAELILGGHIHQAAVAERREFEVVDDAAHATVLVTAPGFGQPRPNRTGEARGLQVHEIVDDALTVSTYLWRDAGWALAAERRFPRG